MADSDSSCIGLPDGVGWTVGDMVATCQKPVPQDETEERIRIHEIVRGASAWLGVAEPSCYLNPNYGSSAGKDGINLNLRQLHDVRVGDGRPNVARVYERFSNTVPELFDGKRLESEVATLRQVIAHEVAHVAQSERWGWDAMKANRIVFELQADLLAGLYVTWNITKENAEPAMNTMMGNQRVLGCEPGQEKSHPGHEKRVQAGLAAMTLSGWVNRCGKSTDDIRGLLFKATFDIAESIHSDPGTAVDKAAEWGKKLVGPPTGGTTNV